MYNHRGKRLFFGIAAITCAACIFGVSSVPSSGLPGNLGIWTNVGHFAEYLALSVFIFLSVHKPERTLWKSAAIAVAVSSLYGVSDEFHQLFVDGRQADVFDWLTDTIGATVGAIGTALCVRAFNFSYQKARTMNNSK